VQLHLRCTPIPTRHTYVNLQGIYKPTKFIYTCRVRVGTRNFILSPQSQFRNLKEALPQSQFRSFLKKCCSATATPQFRNRNFYWSPQLKFATWELHLCTFQHIFGHRLKSGFMKKKLEVKKSHATVPLGQVFGFQRNRQFYKYFWLIFKTILNWEKGIRK
jgi:hypothetical protein